MVEQAFSLFLYIKNDHIYEIGYVCYPIQGDENTLKLEMQGNTESDFKLAKCFPLITPLEYDHYFATTRLGTHLKWFEQIFELEHAVPDPLVCITNV